MFYINDIEYQAGYLAQQEDKFSGLSWLQSDNPIRVGVCVEDTAEWLAFCLFCRKNRIAVMPIHSATPQAAAIRQAKALHCHYLVYQNWNEPIELHTKTESAQTSVPFSGLIQMSSGTTGKPKCIERSWDSIEQEIKNYIIAFPQAQLMTPIVASPITHSYGLICGVLVGLARKQIPKIITQINPRFLLKTLQQHERYILYSSPVQLDTLLRLLPEGTLLHGIMTSGAPLSDPAFNRLRQRTRHLFQQYGCSEAGCIAINSNVQAPNALGIPLPHLRLTTGASASEPAEIVVQFKTSVIHTNDLGYLQQESHAQLQQLYFTARLDDTILVAGLNVYPMEVESVILAFPGIEDAVVFKVQDRIAGERVYLQYVAQIKVDEQQLRGWCTEQLASHQRPFHMEQVRKLPRLPNGKINRRELAAHYLSQREATSA